MKGWLVSVVAACALLIGASASAEEVAPSLTEDTLVEDASDALRTLTASLPVARRHAIPGIYVAIDPSQTDVLALPACDDDGDYVVVLSRALLELAEDVSYAVASDTLRGTELVAAHGELLARAQRSDARPLPPPAPLEAMLAAATPLDDAAHAFERALLAWVVAGELAHALNGDVTCAHPTATHERADDVWTESEHDEALARAPFRMGHLADCDAWAAARVLDLGLSEAPALALLAVLEPFERSRATGAAWTYVTLHPGARSRKEGLERAAEAWRATQRAKCETSPGCRRMR
jgi:hypothetical protein